MSLAQQANFGAASPPELHIKRRWHVFVPTLPLHTLQLVRGAIELRVHAQVAHPGGLKSDLSVPNGENSRAEYEIANAPETEYIPITSTTGEALCWVTCCSGWY